MAVYNNVLGNLAFNNNSWSADEYEIELSENTPDNYITLFEFSYGNSVPTGHIYKSTLSVPLLFSPFIFSGLTVVDTATENTLGNGNGIVEPYETVQMRPSIQNTSPHYLYDITASLNCDFPMIYIWNNYARPDGGGAVYNQYMLGSFDPGQIVQPIGDYVFTDSFSVDYVIPFSLIFKGTISSYKDPLGCSYSYFYNINYNWGIDFNINDTASLDFPPDSLRRSFLSPNLPNSIELIPSDEQENLATVFPNPTDGHFALLNCNDAESFQLLNTLGQVVSYNFQEQAGNTHFDISNHPNGVYFLKINVGNSSKILKIIKN
jgi:hypothetical protein